MARKPKTIEQQVMEQLAAAKAPDASAALKAGLLKLKVLKGFNLTLGLPDDILQKIGPDVVIAVANEEYVLDHIDDFVDMFLEKTTGHRGRASRNALRHRRASDEYEHYRVIAAEIVRRCPRLGRKGGMSELADRVWKKLGQPEEPSVRTIRRALSKK